MSLLAHVTVRAQAGVYITSTALGHIGRSSENCEAAVKELGRKAGVKHMTVSRTRAMRNEAGEELVFFEIWGSLFKQRVSPL